MHIFIPLSALKLKEYNKNIKTSVVPFLDALSTTFYNCFIPLEVDMQLETDLHVNVHVDVSGSANAYLFGTRFKCEVH